LRTVPETRRLLERGMEEIYHVARARGVPLADDIVGQAMALTDTVTPAGPHPCSAILWQGSAQNSRRGQGRWCVLVGKQVLRPPCMPFSMPACSPWNCARVVSWSFLPDRWRLDGPTKACRRPLTASAALPLPGAPEAWR
jgi:hypothetical protein